MSELELPQLDYTDASLRGDRFHQTMRELSAHGWLASGPYGYLALDREAGEFFLRTRDAIFPGMTIAEIFGVREGPLHEQFKRNILHLNGPDHARLRGLLNPALSARAVERYRPAVREFLGELLADARAGNAAAARTAGAADAVADAGRASSAGGVAADGSDAGAPNTVRCEFVEAFAKPYPSRTIALVMGAPLADAARLHHWSNWIQRQFDAASMATERELIEQAVGEFYEYAEALLRARREDPGDDLISTLIAAEQQGERLSDVECINLVFNVLVGGVDTTQSQLAHAVRLLAEHPQQWQLLRREPELAERAVEEALRYEPITPFTARITTAEVTFRDVTFPAGTVVMVSAFTGNRDLGPDAQDDESSRGGGNERRAGGEHLPGGGGAWEFDIAAPRARAHALTFGAGVHYCVGANLARLELQEALRFLAEHVRELSLDGEPEYETITGIYGLARLPVSLSL
ncbi:MAG TPA: cytochrome P450 [Solirubrobacteraceae bacterium]|nr:cytochrome P450 [Solirubrobacteraceae bacterium]